MFDDLISIFSGWYLDFIEAVSSSHITEVVTDAEDHVVSSTAKTLDVWSAYVPWEQIIAAVVLVVLIVSIFKFMRAVICKML